MCGTDKCYGIPHVLLLITTDAVSNLRLYIFMNVFSEGTYSESYSKGGGCTPGQEVKAPL